MCIIDRVKRRKKPLNEFSRIHYRGKTLDNACFRLDNSCEHFVRRTKNDGEQKKTWHFPCVIRTANSEKHYVFPYLQTLTFPENACFQLLTPVNTLLFTRKMPMNKRKTRCLPCINRAVNAGKWIVYLHLPQRKTTEYWDSPIRKRTENVGFSLGKTRVNVSKLPHFPWIQLSFSARWMLLFLPWIRVREMHYPRLRI